MQARSLMRFIESSKGVLGWYRWLKILLLELLLDGSARKSDGVVDEFEPVPAHANPRCKNRQPSESTSHHLVAKTFCKLYPKWDWLVTQLPRKILDPLG